MLGLHGVHDDLDRVAHHVRGRGQAGLPAQRVQVRADQARDIRGDLGRGGAVLQGRREDIRKLLRSPDKGADDEAHKLLPADTRRRGQDVLQGHILRDGHSAQGLQAHVRVHLKLIINNIVFVGYYQFSFNTLKINYNFAYI